MSYGLSTKLLNDFLPVDIKTSSIYDNAIRVSSKIESEIKREKHIYIDGCQAEWERLPRPDLPITVGIDGGYIHARKDKNRKAGWFEAIVGRTSAVLRDRKNKWYSSCSQE